MLAWIPGGTAVLGVARMIRRHDLPAGPKVCVRFGRSGTVGEERARGAMPLTPAAGSAAMDWTRWAACL